MRHILQYFITSLFEDELSKYTTITFTTAIFVVITG